MTCARPFRLLCLLFAGCVNPWEGYDASVYAWYVATDPQAQQTQRMMGFMMIAFGFIFYSFPSGLMVYFIASALYGLVESRLIRRRIAREEESEGGGAAAGITPSSSTTSTSTTPPTATSDAPVYTSKIGKRRKLTKTERKKAKGTYFKT